MEYDVEVYEGSRIKAVKVTGPGNTRVMGGTDPRPKANGTQPLTQQLPPPQLPPPQAANGYGQVAVPGFAPPATQPSVPGVTSASYAAGNPYPPSPVGRQVLAQPMQQP